MRTRSYVVTALLVVTLAAACGSTSSGLSSKSPQQVKADAVGAMKAAHSVSVSGTATGQGGRMTLNLGLTSSGGASGSATMGSQKVQLIALPSAIYVKATPQFWESSAHLSASKAAQIATNWVKVPGSLASISSMSYPSMLRSLESDQGTLSKAGTKSIDGQSVVGVKSSKGGTLWVTASGTPYPVALTGSLDGSTVDLTFSKWNATSVPGAPKGAVSISSLAR